MNFVFGLFTHVRCGLRRSNGSDVELEAMESETGLDLSRPFSPEPAYPDSRTSLNDCYPLAQRHATRFLPGYTNLCTPLRPNPRISASANAFPPSDQEARPTLSL